MRTGTIPAAALAVMLGIGGIGPALAQGAGTTEPAAPARGAGNPAADTRSPGATATEAITDPARVPAGSGPAGTGTPSGTGGKTGGPAAPPGTGR